MKLPCVRGPIWEQNWGHARTDFLTRTSFHLQSVVMPALSLRLGTGVRTEEGQDEEAGREQSGQEGTRAEP